MPAAEDENIKYSSDLDNTKGIAGGNSNLPPEFSHCNFSSNNFPYYGKLVGNYNICFSKNSSSKKIIFQVKSAVRDHNLCFFPTSGDPSGNSVMIGSGRCVFPVLENSIKMIEFHINRPGFTDRTMNSVMIVKDKNYGEVTPYNFKPDQVTYPTAYEDCMYYLARTGDPHACQRFLMKGQYVYHAF